MIETILGFGLAAGYYFIIAVVSICYYIFSCLAHMRALKALGYDNPWIVWIPYVDNFACADAVSRGEDTVMLFGRIRIPALLFKLWWVLSIIASFLLKGNPLKIVRTVLNLVFAGYTYTRMYARIEGRPEYETQAIGCLSGLFPIIAAIKFIGIR